MRMRSAAVVVVVVVAALAAGTSCQRPCETQDNCKRTCDCVNDQTQVRESCTMAFRCEADTQVCEGDFDNLSCNDICLQYDAHHLCGLERCAADAECGKVISCPVLDANGQPVGTRTCTLSFVCDQDNKVCDPASTASDAQLCTLPQCQG